jgi:hypothetical protein
MSEGYTVEDGSGEIAGIVVRQEQARGYRFYSSAQPFNSMDGHIFATPAAAQRAVGDFEKLRNARRPSGRGASEVTL